MSSALQKTVVTLGDLLLDEARRLTARHGAALAWLDLLEPVIVRNSERAGTTARFERREAAPAAEPPPPTGPLDAPPVFDEPGGGEAPAPAARDALRPLVGPAVDRARLHDGATADQFARARGADAVAVGRDIYFRGRAYAPDTPKGLGLLAHELTHVAESERPGADWRRATSGGVREEERLAGARERAAVGGALSPIIAPAFARPAVAAPVSSPPSRTGPPAAEIAPRFRPMHADADRPDPSPDAAAPASAAPPAPNLEAMRRTLFRDLMSQIRVEFERGA